MRLLWATIYEIICSTGRVAKFLNYIKPKNTPYIALCRTYAERCGRAEQSYGNKDGGRQRFRVLCAGNIIHANVGYVMKTRRKHGEVKGIWGNPICRRAAACVLKRKSNSSEIEWKTNRMTRVALWYLGKCLVQVWTRFPAIMLLLRRDLWRVFIQTLVCPQHGCWN